MTETRFDVIVIGAGPGGYVAAIRAAQLGLRVACVEKRPTLGGTCLNVGCIPSKALLTASEKYTQARHHLSGFGITVGEVGFSVAGMMAHKDKVVKSNTAGIEFLFKKNAITWLRGRGEITAPNSVTVHADDGPCAYTATTAIVIASGSEVTPVPGLTIDEDRIVSSTGALTLPAVPPRLVVVGGGVIGLELGSVWSRLGAQVTVVEFLDRILPALDGEISKTMLSLLGRQGMQFRLGTRVAAAHRDEAGVRLSLEPAAGGPAEILEADVVLVAIGRRPHTEGLGLAAVGVACDPQGRILTDARFQTSIPGIYAIGDAIAGPMLAHKAEEEGVAVAEILAGQTAHIDHDRIPGVVYTTPEVASVGKTEDQLKAAGIAYRSGKFPFLANGRARAIAETDGFVKILADARTDQVLGVHIVGAGAGELIGEVVLAMEFSASAEDIARTCHAHPTLSEAIKEAALAVDGRAIHL